MFHLPLLNSLKTFVAAAHYLSFTKAAEELMVSPSAVSHQIKTLENYIGIRLFIREGRSLKLTAQGEELHNELKGPFISISNSIGSLINRKNSRVLNISIRPFFSSSWLAPRLFDFWSKHPEIQINLIHKNTQPDLILESIDAAFIWSNEIPEGLEGQKVVEGNLVPICGREIYEKHGVPTTPEDLSKHVILHEENYNSWNAWLEKSGYPKNYFKKNHIIDDTNVRLRSVLDGQGIMLGCPELLEKDIAEGKLFICSNIPLEKNSYYFVFSQKGSKKRDIEPFKKWLTSQIAKEK